MTCEFPLEAAQFFSNNRSWFLLLDDAERSNDESCDSYSARKT